MELTQPPPSQARKCQCLVTIDVSELVDNLPASGPAPGTNLCSSAEGFLNLSSLGKEQWKNPSKWEAGSFLTGPSEGAPNSCLPGGAGQAGAEQHGPRVEVSRPSADSGT